MDVGSGGGIVRLDGVALPRFPYTLEISNGTTVFVEAVPSFGHVFDGWSGDLDTPEYTTILMVDCNKEISATFHTDWLLFGSIGGCLALVIFLVSVLLIRRHDKSGSQSLPDA
ncbi:hypothetical protein ACFLYQ_03370 [Chloroflexota bacterium]